MKIVFIGAGNVATELAVGLHKYDLQIAQIYSRTWESAENLAKLVGANPVADIKYITTDADLYIFSLKDSVLEDILQQIPSNKGLWLHTAGSMPMNIFRGYTSHFGVLYPFQTFNKSRCIDWNTVPIFIEASDNSSLDQIKKLAAMLSSKIYPLSSEERKYIHLTGVFACNFTNHMYTLGKEILQKAGLPFEIALPLIDETCAKVHTMSPQEAQTGPAVRYDQNVMNKHLSLIEDERVKDIYKLISESIYYKSNK